MIVGNVDKRSTSLAPCIQISQCQATHAISNTLLIHQSLIDDYMTIISDSGGLLMEVLVNPDWETSLHGMINTLQGEAMFSLCILGIAIFF